LTGIKNRGTGHFPGCARFSAGPRRPARGRPRGPGEIPAHRV